MASRRATQGGGRELALNLGSFSYQVRGTPGNHGEGSAWFGPGKPMAPQAPPAVAGRQFDFPQSTNILVNNRQTATITYEMLRTLADSYDLLRLIIETRKDAMERLRWVIQLRDGREKMTPQKRNKIQAIMKFLRKPDGEHDWNTWLRMILEDLFVIDAATIHRRRTRGGKLIALDPIDGATIRRILDDWGRTPEADNVVAYQQILKGMPAVEYSKRDLMFRPRNVRNNKIYGYSPVEQIMMTIAIGLRRQTWQLGFFTEGNMPEALIGVPEQWTPDQIRTFQTWFDQILTGNMAERRKAKFVPNAVGKTYIPTQDAELFGSGEEWLARVTCFAFSISPQPFLKMMNRSTADTSQREAIATGLAPIQGWVKSLIDDILESDFDAGEMEFVWRGDDELDPEKRARITNEGVKGGMLTVNEGRIDNGREPYDDPQFDKPMFMTSNGLAPLTLTAAAQGGRTSPEDGDTKDPGVKEKGGQQKPGGPKEPIEETIEKLVSEGDAEKLAHYLSELQGV